MNNLTDVNIKALAKEFGTPLYVYDQNKIEDNYQRLLNSFRKYYANTHIHYAVKANSNLEVLKIFQKIGANVDCSSPVEVLLAKEAGIDDILYTGNYESMGDFEVALANNARINLDDITSLQRLLNVATPKTISFRINPGIGRGGFEGIVTAGSDAKFGVPYEKALDAYQAAKNAGIKKFGIHMMTGSNNLEPYHFYESLDKLMNIAGKTFGKLAIKPEYIDMGGGFGIPYSPEEAELDIDSTAKLICEVFTEKCKDFDWGEPQLILEPGRYLVGNAGYLITKVTGTKSSYKNFVGVNAGMQTLLRPALYGAEHHMQSSDKKESTETVNICGQICENSDIFAQHIHLAHLKTDDLLIINDVGAYGYAMSSNYNNRPKAAEVMLTNGQPRLIRKRETYEDMKRLLIK